MQTLYEQIGGQPTIRTLVNAFYKRVFTDPDLGPFFTDTSLEKLTRMQEEFFSVALDGPEMQSDISVQAAHQGLRIKSQHMTRFTDHLLSTLAEVGVEDNNANEIVARIAAFSDQVLGDV